MSRIDNLFRRAIVLNGEEQHRFLAGISEEDRAEVQVMLDADRRAAETGGFLSPLLNQQEEVPQKGKIPSENTQPENDHLPNEIGPYDIVKLIGHGGMGQVYLAEQSRPIRRRVALKVIKTSTPTKEILARFEAERQALAMMDHQNIAKVFDADVTENGRPYFAMELVEGVPITDFCDSNKLALHERLRLFVQSCRAIQHAHSKGVLHRDIKPSNVLIAIHDGKPTVKVIDFGLAKALDNTSQLSTGSLATQIGQIIGTLAYMSPEQAEFKPGNVDARADVYSLGVMLYELLAGSPPIRREQIERAGLAEILDTIRAAETPRPSERLKDSQDAVVRISWQRKTDPRHLSLMLKRDLDWIVVKALEKDQERRYDTTSAMADDVERYLNGEAVVARPPSLSYQLQKIFRKHRKSFAVATTTLTLLIVALVTTGILLHRTQNAEKSARISELNANERAADARFEAQRALQMEAAVKIQLAITRWEAGRVADARRLLHEVPPETRNSFEWRFCNQQFQGSEITLFGHSGPINAVAFSPDGTLVASGSSDNTLKIWNSESGETTQTIEHPGSVTCVAFSNDGKRVASGCNDGRIRLWSWSENKLSHLNSLEVSLSKRSNLNFSPYGPWLAFAANDLTIKLWNYSTDTLVSLEGHKLSVNQVAFNPTSAQVASGGRDGLIKFWNIETGKEELTFEDYGGEIWALAFNSDGTKLATGGWHGTTTLWSTATGKELTAFGGKRSEIPRPSDDRIDGLPHPVGRPRDRVNHNGVHDVRFSPDGTRVASARRDGTLRLWDIEAGTQTTLRGHTQSVQCLGYNQAGTRLVSGSLDGTIKLWSTVTPDDQTSLRLGENSREKCFCLAVHPNASLIASGGFEGVTLWNPESGTRVGVLPIVNDEQLTVVDRIQNIKFLTGGTHLAAASVNRIVLWNIDAGTKVLTHKEADSMITDMAVSVAGRKIFYVTNDGTIKAIDATTGKTTQLRKDSTPLDFTPLTVNSIESRLAFADREAICRILDANGSLVQTFSGHQHQDTPGWATGNDVFAIAFNPNGTTVASAVNATIKLWDPSTGRESSTLTGHTSPVSGLAFSPDGKRLASTGRNFPLRLWDTSTGNEILSLGRDSLWDSEPCVAFSTHGTWIAGGGVREETETIRLWRAPFGDEAKPLNHSGVRYVAYSPNSQYVATCSNLLINVWDVTTGQRIAKFAPQDQISHVIFSDNDSIVFDTIAEQISWNFSKGDWVSRKKVSSMTAHSRNESWESPDQNWLAVPSGNVVLLVDKGYKHTPTERAFRRARAMQQPLHR